jgi:fructosamine-3-kinase
MSPYAGIVLAIMALLTGAGLMKLVRPAATAGALRAAHLPSSSATVDNWLTFYFDKRLLTQFKLAEKNGYVDDQFSSLFKNLENKLPNILAGSEEPPSLIHGDLWQGNFLISPSGEPVLIDPAVYYGHREAELAMTKLFGGFPESFYNAYKLAYPLKPGYEYREGIYSLYHVLNHLNLFGSGYKSQAISLMKLYL